VFGDVESGETVEQCRGFVLDLLATPNKTWSSQTEGANSRVWVSIHSSRHFNRRGERDVGVDLVANFGGRRRKGEFSWFLSVLSKVLVVVRMFLRVGGLHFRHCAVARQGCGCELTLHREYRAGG